MVVALPNKLLVLKVLSMKTKMQPLNILNLQFKHQKHKILQMKKKQFKFKNKAKIQDKQLFQLLQMIQQPKQEFKKEMIIPLQPVLNNKQKQQPKYHKNQVQNNLQTKPLLPVLEEESEVIVKMLKLRNLNLLKCKHRWKPILQKQKIEEHSNKLHLKTKIVTTQQPNSKG